MPHPTLILATAGGGVTGWFMQYGLWGLVLWAFAEACVFPFIPDPLLIALCFGAPSQSFVFAGCAMGASMLGSLVGYAIGRYAGEGLLQWMIRKRIFTKEKFDHAKETINRSFWGIYVAALAPIPFKLISITAGTTHMSIWRLLAASIVGRGKRYFVIAALIYYKGQAIKDYVEGKGLEHTMLGIGGVVVLIAVVVYLIQRRRAVRPTLQEATTPTP